MEASAKRGRVESTRKKHAVEMRPSLDCGRIKNLGKDDDEGPASNSAGDREVTRPGELLTKVGVWGASVDVPDGLTRRWELKRGNVVRRVRLGVTHELDPFPSRSAYGQTQRAGTQVPTSAPRP